MDYTELKDTLVNEGLLLRNSGTNSIKSVKDLLVNEGQLLRNSGTNSIKSLKDVMIAFASNQIQLLNATNASNKLAKAQLEQDKEDKEDDKRNKNKKKKKDPIEEAIQAMFDKLGKFKNKAGDGAEIVKKGATKLGKVLAGIGLALYAFGFDFKKWWDNLTGENGLLSQITSIGLTVGSLATIIGLTFKPVKTLTFIVKGIIGTFKLLYKGLLRFGGSFGKGGLLRKGISGLARSFGKGGLLRKGISGLAGMFGKGGALSRGLSNFGGMFGKNSSLMRGLGGLGSKFGGMAKSLGGRRGLLGVLAAGTAAVAAGVTSLRTASPTPTPNAGSPGNGTPDADGNKTTTPDADGSKTTTPDADGSKTTTPDADINRTSTPGPDVQSTSPDAPRASTPSVSPELPNATPPATVAPTPEAPKMGPPPSLPSGSAAATIAGAAADAATPRNVVSAAQKLAIVAKAVGSAGLKSIPIVGAGLGVLFAGMRAWQGDWAGAGAEAGLIFAPGPIGLPGDIALAVRDAYSGMYQAQYGVFPWEDTAENQEVRGPIIMKQAEDAVKKFMGQQDAGKYAPGQLEIQESGDGDNKRFTVVDNSTGEELQSFGADAQAQAQAYIEDHTMSADAFATPSGPSSRLDSKGGTPAPAATPSSRLDSKGGTPAAATPSSRLDSKGGTPAPAVTPAAGTPSGRLDSKGGTPTATPTAAATAARKTYIEAKSTEASIDAEIAALGTQVKVGEDTTLYDMGFDNTPTDIMGFEDKEKQDRLLELQAQKREAQSTARAATLEYTSARDDVQSVLGFEDRSEGARADVAFDPFEKVTALKARGLSDEEIGRDDSLTSNFIKTADGAKYDRRMVESAYDNTIQSELNGPMVVEDGNRASGRYNQATSQASAAAASPGKDVANIIAPMMSKTGGTNITKGGNVTNNYYMSKSSGIDPAAPMFGR